MSCDIKIVIPARYSSTRLKFKSLLLFNNKPLFWHVHKQAILSGFPSENIFVATDHPEIFALAKSLDINVVMTSDTHSSGTERINEVASIKKWKDDTFLINIQGDEPLIPTTLIRDFVEFNIKNYNNDVNTVITSIDNIHDFEDVNVVKVVLNEAHKAIYFSRSKVPLNRSDPNDFSASKRHIGIYGYAVKTLKRICDFKMSQNEGLEKLEQLRFIDNNLYVGAMLYTGHVPGGIDTVDDYNNLLLSGKVNV